MAALLATMKLVLEMHSRGAILSEELGQLQDCRQTTVSVKLTESALQVDIAGKGTYPVSPSATMGRM
jgi:hypothetical protein